MGLSKQVTRVLKLSFSEPLLITNSRLVFWGIFINWVFEFNVDGIVIDTNFSQLVKSKEIPSEIVTSLKIIVVIEDKSVVLNTQFKVFAPSSPWPVIVKVFVSVSIV